MQFKAIIASAGLFVAMASANSINVFGAEDCNDYEYTANFAANDVCVNYSPWPQSWLINSAGNCVVHSYGNPNCQDELAPAQSTPGKCFDSPVAVKSFKVVCS